MSEDSHHDMTSDEMLLAFLDGQLEPEQQHALSEQLSRNEALARRMALLDASRLPLREAFDTLLAEAPMQRMADRFHRASTPPSVAHPYNRRHVIAAAVSFLVIGVATDRGVDYLLRGRGHKAEAWREVVANYMELYSTPTLESLSGDPATLDAQVASVGRDLGISLTRTVISAPGLSLKRAQILQFDNRPLAQLAYLDSQSRPLAMCIFARSEGEAPPKIERRHGMHLVFWSSPTHSFLVIGHLPANKLQPIADHFRQSLPA